MFRRRVAVAAGRIVRLEEAGRRFGADLGITLELGTKLAPEAARAVAARMADRLFEAMDGGSPASGGAGILRLDPLPARPAVDRVTFSGGVAEYIYSREPRTYGDLGMLLAHDRRRRVAIHDAGERQHHLRLAPGSPPAAKRPGDCAGLRARCG